MRTEGEACWLQLLKIEELIGTFSDDDGTEAMTVNDILSKLVSTVKEYRFDRRQEVKLKQLKAELDIKMVLFGWADHDERGEVVCRPGAKQCKLVKKMEAKADGFQARVQTGGLYVNRQQGQDWGKLTDGSELFKGYLRKMPSNGTSGAWKERYIVVKPTVISWYEKDTSTTRKGFFSFEGSPPTIQRGESRDHATIHTTEGSLRVKGPFGVIDRLEKAIGQVAEMGGAAVQSPPSPPPGYVWFLPRMRVVFAPYILVAFPYILVHFTKRHVHSYM